MATRAVMASSALCASRMLVVTFQMPRIDGGPIMLRYMPWVVVEAPLNTVECSTLKALRELAPAKPRHSRT